MTGLKFSLELPTTRVDRAAEFVTGEAVTELTRAAGEAGFDAVNVTDHPAPDARWLDAGGHHALDPFVALAFAAAAHPRIRVHTNIYVAAYRNPFLGASSVHALDVLSGGRVILGVAGGYLKPEFAALGVEFEKRGQLLDEGLGVLDELYSGADVARSGDTFRARGVRLRPPAPAGRPPVWVGGNSRVAMRRAARYEGWAPFFTAGYARASRTSPMESVADLAGAVAYLRDELLVGRELPFDICWSEQRIGDASRSVDERLGRLAQLREAGATWVVVAIDGDDRAELTGRIAEFGQDIIDGKGTR